MLVKFADDSQTFVDQQAGSLVPTGGVAGTAAAAGLYAGVNKLVDWNINRRINDIYADRKTRGFMGRFLDSSAARNRARLADRLKAQYATTTRGKISKALKNKWLAAALGAGGGALGALWAAGKEKQLAERRNGERGR